MVSVRVRTSLIRKFFAASATALALVLACSNSIAQSSVDPQVTAGLWLQRLVGRFSIEGFAENLNRPCGTSPKEPFCSGVSGAMDCIAIGSGPGLQCILNAMWEEKWDIDPERNPMVMEVMGFAPYLAPAMAMYALDPHDGGLRYLLVNNKGHAEYAQGSIQGDSATFTAACVNKAAILGTTRGDCRRVTRIHAQADARIAEMMIDIEVLVKGQWLVATNIVLTLRRVPREEAATQAADLVSRLDEVTSSDEEIDEEESDTGEEGTDAEDAGETQVVEPPASSAPAPSASSKSLLKADALDEVIAESERERQRRPSTAGIVSGPDVITVTLDDTVRMRLQTRIPQSEIRFLRQSQARQPAEGARVPLQMRADRLVSGDAKKLIRDATLEFTGGVNEADGLPALIPFGPGVSLFNIDYVRLRNTLQPTLINLHNAVDPETRRCSRQFGLGDDRGDYPYRFILLGDKLADCNRAVRSREGDLIFADSVPEQLRQKLREFYVPIYNRFSGNLGSEPGLIFVAWRPDSTRDDFRFERSLNRTNLLLFNGAAWEQGFTAAQEDALWEDFALDQVVRRVRWQGEPDAITESAVNYLLELARSARQQSTNRVLSAKLPDWIAACARSLSARTVTANTRQGIFNYDCGLVVHFVYDAVIRSKSSGEDNVHRTWRTLLADSFRRGQSGVPTNVFIDSTPDARRIVQGLMEGSMDWNGFAADMGKLGVQLRIVAGQIAPTAQVVSLTHFHD